MTTLTPTELTHLARLGLARATMALLDGDQRLAELAVRNDDVFHTSSPADALWIGTANLKRIGGVTVELAKVAQAHAPKGSVPDRLHSAIRAMAREADTLIETAVAGHPVDLTAMHHLVDDLLGRVQSGTGRFTAKEARRAVQLGQCYATIADHAAAMSGSRSAAEPRLVA
jgi:hypothetical protein